MGWDMNTYDAQPLPFIQVVDMIRQLESEEAERQSRKRK